MRPWVPAAVLLGSACLAGTSLAQVPPPIVIAGIDKLIGIFESVLDAAVPGLNPSAFAALSAV